MLQHKLLSRLKHATICTQRTDARALQVFVELRSEAGTQ